MTYDTRIKQKRHTSPASWVSLGLSPQFGNLAWRTLLFTAVCLGLPLKLMASDIKIELEEVVSDAEKGSPASEVRLS